MFGHNISLLVTSLAVVHSEGFVPVRKSSGQRGFLKTLIVIPMKHLRNPLMSISINYIAKFVNESNKIEGITREPTSGEILATQDFISLQTITIPDLERLVAVYTF